MKKSLAIIMTAAMSMSLLFGCSGKTTATTKETEKKSETAAETVTEETTAAIEGSAVKTGLSIVTSLSGNDATAEEEGLAKADIAVVAVTVNEDGVIESCVIDAVQAKMNFSATGEFLSADTEFLSKNELGDEYGMRKASAIGKEWNEQAAAVAEYAEGKTVEEIKGIALTEEGTPADEDLAASATVHMNGFISGIEQAVNNAVDLGAVSGDELKLVTVTDTGKSKSATAEEDGVAQAYSFIGAITLNGDTITSCNIDAVQANISFNAEGAITSDMEAEVATKNQLGDAYGMKTASGIGKEWNEQAAAFCEYVTGKTVEEVTGIALTEKGAPADEDLAASVTVSVGDFLTLIEKAAQ